MCGIAGTSELTPLTRNMLRFMALEIESRGRQSWGITDGIQAAKHLGAITDSFAYPEWLTDGNYAIIHTRSASTGHVTKENQHPFFALKPGMDATDPTNYIVGVHNGIISNHTQLNTTHNRNFDVDSQHIFAHIAEEKDTAEMHGYGNVVFAANLPYNPERTLYLFRFNSSDLHVMRMKSGEVVFASTDKAIKVAARMCEGEIALNYKFKDNELFMVQRSADGGWELATTDRKMPFGTRYVPNAATHCSTSYRHGRVWNFHTQTWMDPDDYDDDRAERFAVGTGKIIDIGAKGRYANMCAAKGCVAKVDRKNALLCNAHFMKLEALLDGAS